MVARRTLVALQWPGKSGKTAGLATMWSRPILLIMACVLVSRGGHEYAKSDVRELSVSISGVREDSKAAKRVTTKPTTVNIDQSSPTSLIGSLASSRRAWDGNSLLVVLDPNEQPALLRYRNDARLWRAVEETIKEAKVRFEDKQVQKLRKAIDYSLSAKEWPGFEGGIVDPDLVVKRQGKTVIVYCERGGRQRPIYYLVKHGTKWYLSVRRAKGNDSVWSKILVSMEKRRGMRIDSIIEVVQGLKDKRWGSSEFDKWALHLFSHETELGVCMGMRFAREATPGTLVPWPLNTIPGYQEAMDKLLREKRRKQEAPSTGPSS